MAEQKKMDLTKIIKVSKKKKSCNGFNSKWLSRCNKCGKIFIVWDTEMYNKPCPYCKNEGSKDKREKNIKKDNIFRINRRLYSEYKTLNILSPKENQLLVEFRETEFKSVLNSLISDYWFKPNENKYNLKEIKLIDKRGRKLIENDDFISLLEECYNLILPRA